MPYAEGRIRHDADAHIMETPSWLRDHAEARFRPRLPLLRYPSGNELRQTGSPEDQQRDLVASFDRLRQQHGSEEYRAVEGAEIMMRKNFAATGGFIAEDRPRALDLLGFSSQLIFNTFHNRRLHDLEHGGDLDLAYAAARAHNRGMLEFCSVDPRLLPSCYVPLGRSGPGHPATVEARREGAAALLVASGCPPRSLAEPHRDLFGVWARAEEAGVPVVFHVGGTGPLIDPNYFVNGLPVPHDFHGGDENFRSVDYMGIPRAAGPDPRHPDLRRGARAVPRAPHRGDRAGGDLGPVVAPPDGVGLRRLRPARGAAAGRCRCGRRTTCTARCRFTPYPTEDVGWIVDQAGADLPMFSSDYPHVEGGRKPVERFEASLGDAGDEVRQQFYVDNFLFLMGSAGAHLAR